METDRVLCVDDDPNILDGFQRHLRKKFDLETAVGPEAGLRRIDQDRPYSVVVSDMQMPGMTGVQFLSRVREKSPLTVRMMLTGNADQRTAIDAVNEGCIFRFLTKPCPPEELAKALEAGIRQYHLVMAEKELLEKTLKGSLQVLTEILSLADPQSFGRAEAIRDQAVILASLLHAEDVWAIESAALLSHIGNVTLPPEVMSRVRQRGYLSPEEKDMVGRVPEMGARLLARIPRLERVAEYVRLQSKHFDGSGFPQGEPGGASLPLGARILKTASDMVELSSKGATPAEALDMMAGRSGWYDPLILEKAGHLFRPEGIPAPVHPVQRVEVKVEELALGQTLGADVITSDGRLLISAGHVITETLLERLRNFAKLNGLREPLSVERQAGR